ncbi:site-2 protease family protein [Bacillus paranthracis]
MTFSLAIFIHEFGHMFTAKVLTHKVYWISLGNLRIWFKPFKIEKMKKNKYFFGATLIGFNQFHNSKMYNFGRFKMSIIFLAGPIISILVGFICIHGLEYAENQYFGIILGAFSLAIGIGTLFSDGVKALGIIFNKAFSLFYFSMLVLELPTFDEKNNQIFNV